MRLVFAKLVTVVRETGVCFECLFLRVVLCFQSISSIRVGRGECDEIRFVTFNHLQHLSFGIHSYVKPN